MVTPAVKRASAALFALILLSAQMAIESAIADPMKCSGEEKACITACTKTARVTISVCVTGCGARLSACMKTGCWDNGTQRYCGVAKL
jgi:hypothetical protein